MTDDIPTLSPELPWPILRRQLDRAPERVVVALEERLERMCVAGRADDAVRELREPDLRVDAPLHRPVAAAVLRILRTLAWHTPEASALLALLHDRAPGLGLSEQVTETADEIGLAARVRRLGLPRAATQALGDRSLTAAADWQRVWREADAALAGRAPLLLSACLQLHATEPALMRAILERLAPRVPADRDKVAAVSPDVDDALARGLRAIPRGSVWLRLRDSLRRTQRQRPYRERLRPAIASTLLDVGLPVHVAVAWISAHDREVPHLARWTGLLASDVALQLHGVVAALMRDASRALTVCDVVAAPYRT